MSRQKKETFGMSLSNLETRSLLLSDVLLDHRTGLRLERFLPKSNPIDCMVLRNGNLRDDLRPTGLWATEGEPCSLEKPLVQKRKTSTLERNELAAGDVLVPLTFGRFWASCVPPSVIVRGEAKIPSFAYSGLMVLKPNPELILPEYLTLWLRGKAAADQISRLSTKILHGVKRFAITLESSRLLSISVPPLSVQADFLQDYSKLTVRQQQIGSELEDTISDPGEEWRPVVGWEESHEVSNLGRVRSLPRKGCGGRVRRSTKHNKSGHLSVSLHYKGKRTGVFVHRLVMLAFHGGPPIDGKSRLISCGITHKDGDKLNNHAENLQWLTVENSKGFAKMKNRRQEMAQPPEIISPPRTFLLRDVVKTILMGIQPGRHLTQEDAASCILLNNANLGARTAPLSLFALKGECASLRGTKLSQHELRAGDVLASTRFIEFYAACVPKEVSEWSCEGVQVPCYPTNNLVAMTPSTDLILPEYLTLWLRSESAIGQIAQRSRSQSKEGKSYGRHFSAINISELMLLSICVPSLSLQADLCQAYSDTVREKHRIDSLLGNQFMEKYLSQQEN